MEPLFWQLRLDILISGQAVSLRPQQEVAVGRKGTKPHNATKMSDRKDTFPVLYSPALFLGLRHDDQGVLRLQHFDLWVALQRALEAFDPSAQHNAGIMFMNVKINTNAFCKVVLG